MWISVIALLFLVGCEAFNEKFGVKDDNIVEEILEDVIKKETGIDMDLTPSSEEK
jgi:hypothetical protein